MKGPKISGKAGAAKVAFDEAKIKRNLAGKFADKPGAGDDAPKTGKTSGVSKDDKITLLVKSNPKKPGSASHAHFEGYKDGMTVQQFIDGHPGGKSKALADLAWDQKKGFVSLGAGKTTAAPKAVPPPPPPPSIMVDKNDVDLLTPTHMKGATIHVSYMGAKKQYAYDPTYGGGTEVGSLATIKANVKKGSHTVQLAPGVKVTGAKGPVSQATATGTPAALAPVKPSLAASPAPSSQVTTPKSARWDKAPATPLDTKRGAPAIAQAEATRAATGQTAVSALDEATVNYYVGSGYLSLNSSLRAGKTLEGGAYFKARDLDKLIADRKSAADVVMYRGIGTSSGSGMNFNDLPPPPDFVDRGYSSVSAVADVSNGFSGSTSKGNTAVFRVRVPKGTPMVHVKRGLADNALADEAEFVLGRNTRYRYIGDGGLQTVGYAKNVRIIDVEVIPDA